MEAPLAKVGKKNQDNYQLYEQFDLNDDYKILLGVINENNLVIDLIEKKKNMNYRVKLTLENLIHKSKAFKMCDNFNDCIEILRQMNKEKLITIIPKDNNQIILHFNKFMISQEFDILLLENELNQYEVINQLSNRIKKLEEKVEILEKWKNEVDKKININIQQNIISSNIESKIIKKKEEIEFLEKCLKRDDPLLNKKNIKFKLLYRATRDGEHCSIFHSKCDEKPNTLFVVQTLKGLKFGGYCDKTWEPTGCKEDNNCFVYSLDLLKKYRSKSGKKIMNPDKDRGPRFQGWVIWIGEKFLSQNCETCSKTAALNNFEGFTKDCEINNGEFYFNLSEFEMFQIIME